MIDENSKTKALANPAPWRITDKPFQIVDANGLTVAKLTSMDLANAELICKCVNQSYVNFPKLIRPA